MGGKNVVCEINSALLHYFMLVYFGWTAAEAINLYVKLVKVLGAVRFLSSHYVLKAGLIVWREFHVPPGLLFHVCVCLRVGWQGTCLNVNYACVNYDSV